MMFDYIAIYHKVVTTKNHLLSRWPFSLTFLGQELESCASHRWIDLARQISIFSGICADLQQIPCLQRFHLDRSVKGLYTYNWSYLFSLPSRSSNWTTDFQLYYPKWVEWFDPLPSSFNVLSVQNMESWLLLFTKIGEVSQLFQNMLPLWHTLLSAYTVKLHRNK